IYDHGLFVAGIVSQVAPNSEIDPIRVLNNYGAETLASVLNGLNLVGSKLGSDPVVVNLSLTVSVPTTIGQLTAARSWLNKIDGTPVGGIGPLARALDQWYQHEDLHRGACLATQALYDNMLALAKTNKVYFIAAAGNDGTANDSDG